LRAAHVGIDLSTFQEDFDLGESVNNFESVASAIQKRHSSVRIVIRSFPTGEAKLKFIEQRLAEKNPVLISFSNGPDQGWHIMPVVDATSDKLLLLESVDSAEKSHLRELPKTQLVWIHDHYKGGDDVAFLDGEQR
jgi:hypothetical protein